MLGTTVALSDGTFQLVVAGAPMANEALFTLPVHFSARRNGAELSMDGIDVMRVAEGRIVEVWLFSAVQEDEGRVLGPPP